MFTFVNSAFVPYSFLNFQQEYIYGSKRRSIFGLWAIVLLQFIDACFYYHFEFRFSAMPLSISRFKIILIALTFLISLWADCSRNRHIAPRVFFAEIWRACTFLAPVFPFVAILISFGLMLMRSIFDFFRFPTRILHWPIYYLTIYGPFAIVYHRVKRWAFSLPILPRAVWILNYWMSECFVLIGY